MKEVESQKEIEFLKDEKVVLKNEVVDFKKGTKHKFEKIIAEKLVSQKAAQYVTEIPNQDKKNIEDGK